MKTLKTFSLLVAMLCIGFYANAQFLCGVRAGFTFSVNPNNVCSFYDSTQVDANWQVSTSVWNFGDGSTSVSTQNPTHVYPSPGTYQACLIVTAAGLGVTCVDTFCQTITVGATGCGNTQASFTISNSGSGTVVLQSTSTGVGSGALYQWWMDGNIVASVNPNTAFTINNVATGQHNFCLYVYANNISTFCDSSCRTETIGSGCTIPVTIHDTIGQNGTRILYATSTGGGIVAYGWSNGATPSDIIVNASGTYCVTVTNANNCTGTACINVNIGNPCSGLDANFTQTYAPTGAVTFTGVSNNINVSHIWHFGDGTPPSNQVNPTHCYNANGLYMVYHIVSIPGTICADTAFHQIQANVCNPCVGFAVNIGWGTNPLLGGFNVEANVVNNTSTPVVYLWSTGDTGRVIRVAQPGVYCVTATSGNCTSTTCDSVGFGCNLSANITTQNTTSPFVLTAHAVGGTGPYTYTWTNGALSNPITVTAPGVYCLTITDAAGCTATACYTTGNNNCNIQATIVTQSTTSPYVLTAYATGGTPGYTFHWFNGQISNQVTVTNPGNYCLTVVDANQCTATACYQIAPPQGTDTICGIVFEDTNGNGILDSTEHGIGNALVYAGNYSIRTDSFGHYVLIVPAGTYSIIYCAPTGFTYTIPVSPNSNGLNCNGYYQVAINGGGTHCGFNFGVRNNSVTMCGVVYLDANNNQIQNPGENGVANAHVYITGANGHVYHAYTNANGEYCVCVPAGTYTITVTSNTFNTCPVTPQTLTVAATAVGQTYVGNNFAAYCQPGLCNLSVNVTPHTTVTPGFAAWYDIQVCNVGSSVSGGTLNFFYDGNALAFDHASPVQTSHNASTNTVSWNVNPMLPGNCRYYWVYFDAHTSVTIGQQVFTLVNTTPDTSCNDINMNNNVDTIHQAATASWDPNNKFAFNSNYETNPGLQWVSSLNADQRIEYIINFQNLGTGPAVNVVVKDVISGDLDLSSFEFLGASHPCIVTEDNGELNYKFSNIMLAAESVDEPNSHGWVKFAINSVNGLQGGYVITDEADIYFDYNAPVTTNDAAVVMVDANGIEEVITKVAVVIAPNPMNQYAEIRINSTKADGFRFRVMDLTGRLVIEKVSDGNTLLFERNALAGGLYTYQVIQSNTAVAKGKLVIE